MAPKRPTNPDEGGRLHPAVIIAIFVAIMAVIGALAWFGYNPERAIRDRALLLRACPSGVLVGLDPQTGRLTWENPYTGGLVAPGVTADQVCAQQGGKR